MDKSHFSLLEQQLSSLLEVLASIPEHHSPSSALYKHLDLVARYTASNLFGENSKQSANLGFLGEINIPYFSMGAINSTHLFGLDELIIFSFYHNSRNIYQSVADLGANIGLHTIVLSKLGYNVISYEPDPIHIKQIKYNISKNSLDKQPQLFNKAVSSSVGEVDFIRVIGNTTGSHISGSKSNPYGELDNISVQTDDFINIMNKSDLMKIDIEGHEPEIILKTTHINWSNVDALLEVGTKENGELIFNHLNDINVNMFSQKIGWQKVDTLSDMPSSYKDGSLFITTKITMPW